MTKTSSAQNSTENLLQRETFSIVGDISGRVISSGHESVRTSVGNTTKTDKDHTRMFTHGLIILCQMELQGNELRVFLACVAFCDFENKIAATNAGIAKLLNMRPQHVSRALHKLHQLGMIYITTTEGGKKIARVQPEICWKGSEKHRTKEVKVRNLHFANEAMEHLTGRLDQHSQK